MPILATLGPSREHGNQQRVEQHTQLEVGGMISPPVHETPNHVSVKKEPMQAIELTEVDKRRRNTAALARFRIKKKLKEKSMDAKLQEMEQAVREYESKIQRLEMENKILRTLIVERGSKRSDEELQDLRRRAGVE